MATKSREDKRPSDVADYDPLWEVVKNAPWDDEPLTEDDEQAIKEADENFAAGRFVTHEELKRELGL